MSATKVAGSPNTIRFSQTVSTLFNKVKMASSYRSRLIVGQDGKNAFDKYAMTESEYDMFIDSLGYVVVEVFSELSKIAHGVVNSVWVDTDESSTAADVGFSLKDYAAYDDNTLTIIDKKIQKCYVAYCLAEWWANSGQDAISKEYDFIYRENLMIIKDKAWSLIKPLMT